MSVITNWSVSTGTMIKIENNVNGHEFCSTKHPKKKWQGWTRECEHVLCVVFSAIFQRLGGPLWLQWSDAINLFVAFCSVCGFTFFCGASVARHTCGCVGASIHDVILDTWHVCRATETGGKGARVHVQGCGS
jgi:hypothetical protein